MLQASTSSSDLSFRLMRINRTCFSLGFILIRVLFHPGMFKNFLDGDSFILRFQYFFDQIFGTLTDSIKLRNCVNGRNTFKCIVKILNSLHNVFISRSLEWGNSRKKNVENDSRRPNITPLVITLRQHLRGHVVGLNIRKLVLFRSFSCGVLFV